MALTECEAKQLLATPKIARGPLSWIKKISKDSGEWHEARTSVSFASEPDVILEGMQLIFQFRKSNPPKSDIITLGLVVGDSRVCALDVQPDDEHKNNVGKGKPHYRQWIGGIHLHQWSDEGYGYAEPCAVVGVQEYAKAWTLFQAAAGVTLDSDLDWPIQLYLLSLI